MAETGRGARPVDSETSMKRAVTAPAPAPKIPDEFWLSLGYITACATRGQDKSEAWTHIEKVFRILADAYPEMAPLRKYLPLEPAP